MNDPKCRVCASRTTPKRNILLIGLHFPTRWLARPPAAAKKKAGPLPNLPENIWWRRGSSRGGAQRRENGPVNRFQREGGEAGFASPYSPRLGGLPATAKKAGPLPNLPGKFWWRRGESNGVCAARIRGACSRPLAAPLLGETCHWHVS